MSVTSLKPSPHCSEEEWKVRVELAAAIRISALNGWDELTLAHLSARAPDNPDHMLLHSDHRLFEEVTASNLHKLDEHAEHVVAKDETPHKFAFHFHRGIYKAFPQANSVVHLHTRPATAVAMQEQGLLMGNQYALWLGPIGYHDYLGLMSSPDEGLRLSRAFGSGQIVLQRGHGFVVWGHGVREAFMLAYLLHRACETQIMSGVGAGGLKPYIPPQDVIDVTFKQARVVTDGSQPFTQVLWAALLRKLDRVAPDYCQ
jgi:ribulose-5-phosphate 4-epimerase/fuculose-1-phosphate aldolase